MTTHGLSSRNGILAPLVLLYNHKVMSWNNSVLQISKKVQYIALLIVP